MRYLVSWNLTGGDDKLPFGLSLVINPTVSETLPSTMERVKWLEVAMHTGTIHDDWDVEDGYFVWRFKTESARTYFMLATGGEGDNEAGVTIRWF